MSNTHCRFCDVTLKGLYINCPKCGKYLIQSPYSKGKDVAPEPYKLAKNNKPSDHWSSELVRTVQECRSENSDLRFGQLLYNLIARDGELDADFHARLFHIEDTELVKLLKNYAATGNL